jgi:hypothetical protein
VPLYLGGDADVLTFRHFVPGFTYVTSGLTGVDDIPQRRSRFGNYELMICTRDDAPWAAGIISSLARYTLDARLEDGETMDYPMFPSKRLSALLFAQPPGMGLFSFGGSDYHCLLCIGITAKELRRCHDQGSAPVIATLKQVGVFPFTSLDRR